MTEAESAPIESAIAGESAAPAPATPDPTEVAAAIEAPSKRGTRVFLRVALSSATVGLISCLSLGIIIFINLDDQEPFDDARLIAREAPVPDDQNAGPAIRRAMQSLDGTYFWNTKTPDGTPLAQALGKARFGSFSLGGDPAPAGDLVSWRASPIREVVEAAISTHTEFYIQVDAACKLPRWDSPEPSYTTDGIDKWYGRSREAWQLMQLRSDAAYARGDREGTVAADLAQLRYSVLFLDGAHTMVQRIAALAQVRAALITLTRHFEAGFFTGHEADVEQALAAIGLDRADASEAIRVEYRLFRSMTLDTPEMISSEEIGERGASYLFHPNETLRTIGDYYLAAIAEGEATGRVLDTEPPKIETGWVGKILKGNGLGHVLMELAPLELDSIYVRTEEVILEIAALERLLAGK